MDEGLRPFATERQWEALCAIAENGGVSQAARALGVTRATIQGHRKSVEREAAKHGYAPDHDLTHPVAPGQVLRGVSTLYDGEGNVRAQWVKSKADQQAFEEIARQTVEALKDDISHADPVPPPEQYDHDLLTTYVVGDHHYGLLTWHEEVGESYDLKRGEQLLSGAMRHLVKAAPPSVEAVIILIGDFLHYDSMEAVTPTSGHRLDPDSRFPQVIGVALRSIRRMIEAALTKHSSVKLIIEVGNHDLASSIWLMHAMALHYELEPRVEVDTSPSHFHYHEFGRVLIGTTHGKQRGCKLEQLGEIMACDQPDAWGRTKHRHWFTGHIHTKTVIERPGCTIESVRILPPADAYAYFNAYRSGRGMNSIVFHRQFGEVARNVVNPEMIDAA